MKIGTIAVVRNNSRFPDGEKVRILGYCGLLIQCEYLDKSGWWLVEPSQIENLER